MKPRSLVILLLLIGLPTGLLIGAAVRLAESEQNRVQQKFADLARQQLLDIGDVVAAGFTHLEARLQEQTSLDDPDVVKLRAITRSEPAIMQMFLLDAHGNLIYPDPQQKLSGQERRFLLQTSRMFSGGHLFHAVSDDPPESVRQPIDPPDSAAAPRSDHSSPVTTDAPVLIGPSPRRESEQTVADTAGSTASPGTGLPPVPRSGWFAWYWDRGLNLIYWNRRPDGRTVGAALERSRWLADVISWLPDSPVSVRSGSTTRIQLVDASGTVMYQWGRTDSLPAAAESLVTVSEMPLASPLTSWRLRSLLPADDLPGPSRGSQVGFLGGVIAVVAAVGVLSLVLIRDYTRDLREARQQVSFVSQVSHELKTPLTNIRLYAELLDRDLDRLPEEQTRTLKQRLNVILREGHRLSRLIGNVLSLSRRHQDIRPLKRESRSADEVIRRVLTHFEPSLADRGIQTAIDLNAESPVWINPDCLEQILGNLISNVEKYAAAGGRLQIRSRLQDTRLIVDVQDRGPGIPESDRERIFEPFWRGSRGISEATGTGIGLTIARQLARQHGGTVRLVPSAAGCHFEIVLDTQPARQLHDG